MIKKEVWVDALAHLIKQGPMVILLFFGLNYFVEKFDKCNSEIIELYREQNEKLIEVVKENSNAFKMMAESKKE